MEITRENYEIYFLDYLEGNLDEKLVDDFIEFLQLNPDLKEELSAFENVSLEAENLSFEKKDKLYKEKYDNESVFNTAAVADLEGYISESEKNEFENYLNNHPEKRKDIALFAQTKLVANSKIHFPNKKKLYKSTLAKTILLWSGRVAAALILIFAINGILQNQSDKILPENQVAEVKDKAVKKESPVEIEATQTVPKKETEEKAKKTKPEIKKAIPVKKSNKSIREKTKGRMEHQDVAVVPEREKMDMPEKMKAISAKLDIATPVFALVEMPYIYFDNNLNYEEERLLADVVKEKTGLNNFKFNKITKAGLNLVSSITKENFTYETNEDGKVIEYSYDSRLLAFSIPTKNENIGD